MQANECEVILFLDFDGVTHREAAPPRELFGRLPGIEDVLRRYPSVGIVISSTWRRAKTPEEMASRFSTDIAARIVGQTPYLPEEMDFSRQVECVQWLRMKAWG